MLKSFKNQCFEKNGDPPLTETPSCTSQMYRFYSIRTGIDRLGVSWASEMTRLILGHVISLYGNRFTKLYREVHFSEN